MTTEQMDDKDAQRAGFKDAADQRAQQKSKDKYAKRSLRDLGREIGERMAEELTASALRYREHHENMAYEVTPAQRLMREEMAGMAHVGVEVDKLLGVSKSAPEVQKKALAIIEEMGPGLVQSLQGWKLIQDMVEAGIKAGYAEGLRDVDPHAGCPLKDHSRCP